MLFVVLLALSLISAIANEIWTAYIVQPHWYLGFQGMTFEQLFLCIRNMTFEQWYLDFHNMTASILS